MLSFLHREKVKKLAGLMVSTVAVKKKTDKYKQYNIFSKYTCPPESPSPRGIIKHSVHVTISSAFFIWWSGETLNV